jgi:hypothetical protein
MDSTECEPIDRINHELDRPDARDGKSIIIMVATALVASALVFGMMWTNTTRQDSPNSRTLAEQQ